MRLLDLEPEFMIIIEPGGRYQSVDSLAQAQGVQFLCPACFAKNAGPIGTHSVLLWFLDRGVPDDEIPLPGRWTVVSGSGLGDLTLTASILLTADSGCVGWHGHITTGEAVT